MPVPEGKDLDALMYRLLRMKCPKASAPHTEAYIHIYACRCRAL